ncbi:30S ribosome-binding factor [Buchnera aphidicola (Phyllaphis fagi)]|uniref:30S ribosome-binding factor RbfA n=1 Tax=Buchnera aphidicola TaxID=9 RepID=UPI0034638C26
MKLLKQYYKKDVNRSVRISNMIKKEVSLILTKYIKDPRINFMITISMVKTSNDLSLSQIFFSYLGNYQNSINDTEHINNITEIIKILKNASGYIRKMLSKNLRLRVVPFLIFYHDDSLLSGIKISNLIKHVLR